MSDALGGVSVVGMSSGTDALLAGLMALGVRRNDRVLTTPFSFFATAGTISRLGAVPRFADIEPTHFEIDLGTADAADLASAKVVIPVHLFGHVMDVDAIRERAPRAPILEDAAQAIGATDAKGRIGGTIGAIGAFSFFPTKNLGAAGDAGMAVTRDPALFEALRTLRAHGQRGQYEHAIVGGNFRLDAIQAAVLLAALPHLKALTALRRENAARYDALLRESGLVDGRVVPPAVASGHSFHQYVVRVTGGRRDAVQAALKARGIGSMVYYPIPFHLQQCFRDLGYAKGAFPEAERAAAEVLALPIFPGLRPSEQDEVVAALKASLDERR
jgi:dTDP-4-amino-4,6-dideoxygalactose transaminase